MQKRRWLDDATYAEWVALCQFLPGPASSQLGMAIGFGQARLSGAIVAWLGFTLPSALILMLLAYAVADGFDISPFVAGLKIVAVAVVAQALWGMSRSLVNGVPKLLLLTHVVWMGGTEEEVIAGIRKGGYTGPVLIGEDLGRY